MKALIAQSKDLKENANATESLQTLEKRKHMKNQALRQKRKAKPQEKEIAKNHINF